MTITFSRQKSDTTINCLQIICILCKNFLPPTKELLHFIPWNIHNTTSKVLQKICILTFGLRAGSITGDLHTCSIVADLPCTALRMCVRLRSSPVVLYARRLISDGRQVHFGPIPVRQAQQLLDHIVSHLLHELQGLHVVAPRGEDLVQPCEVLVEAASHATHGARHLEGKGRQKWGRHERSTKHSGWKGWIQLCIYCPDIHSPQRMDPLICFTSSGSLYTWSYKNYLQTYDRSTAS